MQAIKQQDTSLVRRREHYYFTIRIKDSISRQRVSWVLPNLAA